MMKKVNSNSKQNLGSHYIPTLSGNLKNLPTTTIIIIFFYKNVPRLMSQFNISSQMSKNKYIIFCKCYLQKLIKVRKVKVKL